MGMKGVVQRINDVTETIKVLVQTINGPDLAIILFAISFDN